MELILIAFIPIQPKYFLISIYSHYKKQLGDVLPSFFCYSVFQIWRVFYAYSTSQFGLATFQVPSLHMGLWPPC